MNRSHPGAAILWIAAFSLILAACRVDIPEISGTAYYVDCADGDDTQTGRSAHAAWRTLEKVNATPFAPGDGIFFRRGTTCPGTLHPLGSGEAERPILIAAYGQGKRPIVAGGANAEAIRLYDQEYWRIQDLETTGGTRFGVLVSGSEARLLHGIQLVNLEVHAVHGGSMDNKVTGLVVVGSGQTFADVLIDGVTAYDTSLWGGIIVVGGQQHAQNVIVRNATVHHTYGDGIVLWSVDNGLIETSVAYETGLQPAPQTIGTPSSIWTWGCNDCIVQLNESYNAHSPQVDSGAFDVDWATQRNLYQYNYGHDCDGYCISIFGAGGQTTTDAVIRYNICANNGRRGDLAIRQGDVFISTWDGGKIDGVKIYNNTIVWNPARNAPFLVNHADLTGELPRFFKNNLVVSSVPWLLDTADTLELDYNLYWYQGENPPVWLYGKNGVYTDFAEYQKSGQDAHGLFADPLLDHSTAPTIGRPTTAFTLDKNSPAIGAGNDLGEMGGRDFFGTPIPIMANYDIGAAEWFERPHSPAPAAISPLSLRANIDPRTPEGRSQVVFLQSVARQFNLAVEIIIPAQAASPQALANLSADWGLPVRAAETSATMPTTLLLDAAGKALARWEGLALPSALAAALGAFAP